VTESASPQGVVVALVRVINGELPIMAAEEHLDPQVKMHMDSAQHRGITLWYKWIHLIRNCGRVSDLRMVPVKIWADPQEPGMVHLWMCWSGTDRGKHTAETALDMYHVRYLIQGGRIVEIWTHKANYVFIFGEWIRYSACYRLFLGWAMLHFALEWLWGKDYRADVET
jgi:hypothetical protein